MSRLDTVNSFLRKKANTLKAVTTLETDENVSEAQSVIKQRPREVKRTTQKINNFSALRDMGLATTGASSSTAGHRVIQTRRLGREQDGTLDWLCKLSVMVEDEYKLRCLQQGPRLCRCKRSCQQLMQKKVIIMTVDTSRLQHTHGIPARRQVLEEASQVAAELGGNDVWNWRLCNGNRNATKLWHQQLLTHLGMDELHNTRRKSKMFQTQRSGGGSCRQGKVDMHEHPESRSRLPKPPRKCQ